jgi:hypothetical protein
VLQDDFAGFMLSDSSSHVWMELAESAPHPLRHWQRAEVGQVLSPTQHCILLNFVSIILPLHEQVLSYLWHGL